MDYYAVWCDENGHVTIESGEFKTNGNAVLGMSATQTDLIIKGGNFETNGKPLVLEGNFGSPVISGGRFDTDVDESILLRTLKSYPALRAALLYATIALPGWKTKRKLPVLKRGYTGDLYCAACGKKSWRTARKLNRSGTTLRCRPRCLPARRRALRHIGYAKGAKSCFRTLREKTL